ncbi:uncharacterized protein LOC8277924 [Ricinus communis]|uniref:uncharacterized protein LOC8277924 n=1 Tax=Ricinus communis TaxID=3988 RepID=UPI0007723CDC|nr:uncharacterized protein LOC8277924 [Ricinus communis]XP_015574199.1 uncharacterized protein LOC8277924 [Ricinus communis]|eukprot:XP_015574198.1 uncharacterized protein LOC8277924 [Ricinus communis]
MRQEDNIMEVGDGTDESKKRKRKLGALAEHECCMTTLEKIYKRIILSLAKPSYLLGLGSDNLRPENRARLRHLLRKLVRQHCWTEASGVLSVLLKGTCKENHPTMNRFKYLVSMEFIKHLETDNVNLTSVNQIYDIWMTRIGINLSSKRKRNGSMKEANFIVRLESILFRLMQGNIEGERQNARSLMQESEFEGHPMFNMIVGLIFSQLCYSNIPEDMKCKDSNQIRGPTYTHMSVTTQLDMSATGFRNEVGGSEGHNSLFDDESESCFRCTSETSIMNCKEMPVKVNNDLQEEVLPVEIDVNLQTNVPQDFQPQAFYVNSAEDEVSVDNNGDGHMHFVPNLSAFKSGDSWLLPLRTENWELKWVIQADEYNHAVRYLQSAVYSTPPVFAALIPLIQLLLIGRKYREALDELEKFCGNLNAALPIRLRAHLLELVDPKNTVVISSCFEDTLKTDPTCRMSLDKLISLHQKGNYSPESLLEMIALHLEAVFGEYKIWKEFALCFLQVSQYEEDCMSACLYGDEGKKIQGYSVRYNRIPKLFICGRSGINWRFRCRWWLTRHFSKKLLVSEIAAGNLEFLAYKAACAAHMYGTEFDYFVKAYTFLEKENNRSLFMFLQLHMQNHIGINLYYQRRTN